MPKGFKVSWKDDAYATFAEDMHALLDTCVSIRQSNAIKDVSSGLQKIYDAMPAGEARDALSDVIKKLSDMQTFIDDFVKNKGAKSSAINRLYKSAYSGDTGESMYRSDIQEMKIYLRDKKVLFFQSQYDQLKKKNVSEKGALPLDLREVLDRFNLKDDYNSYDRNEDLFKRVDDLFNKFGQMQTYLIRIYSMQDKHVTENTIKDFISDKESELKNVGRMAYENKDIIFSAVDDEKKRVENMMKDSDGLRAQSDKICVQKSKALEDANKKKTEVEAKKEEYDKSKVVAENRLKEISERLKEIETNEGLVQEAKKMKLSDLTDFTSALMEETPSAGELIEAKYVEIIRQKRENQHQYSDEVQKNNKEMHDMVAKHKDLKAFYDKVGRAKQSEMYREMILTIWRELKNLPASLDLGERDYTIMVLQSVLQKKLDKDERVAVLYEAVSVAAQMCPPELKAMTIDEVHFKEAIQIASNQQEALLKDKSYEIALGIFNLMEESQDITVRLAKMDGKDPERKTLEDRQKVIKSDIENKRKSKGYIKNSEKLLGLMKKSGDNTQLANKCRFDIIYTYNQADSTEAELKKSKAEHIAQTKNVIITDMERIIKKLPAEPKDLVENMKKAVSEIKASDNIAEVKRAHKSFRDNLDAIDKNLKGETYDLNKEADKINKDKENWDYDTAMKACDDNITKCQKEVDEAYADYDKHQASYQEYRKQHKNLSDISINLDRMYRTKQEIQRFESDKDGAIDAANELKGKAFFGQMQRNFMAFSNRKDHNKGDHKNTDEYRAMDTKLSDLLAMDPGSVTAESYRTALSNLKNAALSYIEKKKAQSFHWIPSKLRKYRLQYAKGLADICSYQLDTIDASDFAKIDDPVKKYLGGVIGNPQKEEEITKTQYLSHLADLKQEGLKAYRISAGITDETVAVDGQTGMQMNNAMQKNTTQVNEPLVEGAKFEEIKKKTELA